MDSLLSNTISVYWVLFWSYEQKKSFEITFSTSVGVK